MRAAGDARLGACRRPRYEGIGDHCHPMRRCSRTRALLCCRISFGRPTSHLAQICARVDYMNGLQENLKRQEAASEEVPAKFKALVEQCRTTLRNRPDEND